MALDIIIGAQWGDEGKGRMVDTLAAHAAIVARFSGGDNAGHTVTVGDEVFKLHLIPSGMIHPHSIGVIGNGVVLNPETLLAEMKKLGDKGIDVSPARLKISYGAHIITPAHRALDAAQEAARGTGQIGTTLRGIGPAYVDKVARRGLRIGEMSDPESFADRIKAHVEFTNQRLTKLYGAEPLDAESTAAQFTEYARILGPYTADTGSLIDQALKKGERVLAEGAQGTLLDIDHGSYPFVTSSSPTAAGAISGLGAGIQHIGEIVGVTKAFQTRVGEGAMPTELEGETAGRLRGSGANPWDEFGTTTGRPRRVGWLDLMLLRYAARINGFSKLAITKLDILSGIDPLKVCTGYTAGGRRYSDLPQGLSGLEDFEPVYEDVPGWQEDVSGARRWEDLPAAAQNYLRKIEQVGGVPVGWVSVGPEREQLVVIAG